MFLPTVPSCWSQDKILGRKNMTSCSVFNLKGIFLLLLSYLSSLVLFLFNLHPHLFFYIGCLTQVSYILGKYSSTETNSKSPNPFLFHLEIRVPKTYQASLPCLSLPSSWRIMPGLTFQYWLLILYITLCAKAFEFDAIMLSTFCFLCLWFAGKS